MNVSTGSFRAMFGLLLNVSTGSYRAMFSLLLNVSTGSYRAISHSPLPLMHFSLYIKNSVPLSHYAQSFYG